METLLGVLVVGAGGLCMGTCIWPMKLMRTFQFEHWWFLAMLVGLVIIPWAITLTMFPGAIAAYSDVPLPILIRSNLFAVSWGIANVLCGLCFVRIGVALTGAILTGLGASVGVIVPMIFKGSGLFKDSPDVISPAGLTVLAGVGVMLIGVLLASWAGFGRDRQLKALQQTSGSFLGGLIMTVIAGITSAGLTLAFVYGQGPIVARVCMLEVGQPMQLTVADNAALTRSYMIAQDGTIALVGIEPVHVAGLSAKAAADKIAGMLSLSQQPETSAKVRVETANILAVFPVWAIALLGGVLVNLLYPAWLMTKNNSWGILATSWREVALSIVMGCQFCLAIVLGGKGMILLGVLGASVGEGIRLALQMVGNQGLGFVSGEWHGVHGKPRRSMYLAIAMLAVATIIMAFANTLAK